MKKILYGIGTGPGDPDLLTIKAVKIMEKSAVIFAPNNNGKNMALDTAKKYIKDKKIVLLDFPMKSSVKETYKNAINKIDEILKPGETGSFLNIGDSTIYSTFLNMVKEYDSNIFEIHLVPGIPSYVAAANELKKSLAMKGERLLICDSLEGVDLESIESIAILKTSKNLENSLNQLEEHGFEYSYMNRVSFKEQKILEDRDDILKQKDYISLIIGRRKSL